MNPKQAAIIFDFDGTIADTVLAFARVFEELTKLPEPLTPQKIKELKGLTPAEFIREFNLPKWKIPYLIFRGRRMLRDHMADIRIHPGMSEVIKRLHSHGVPLYIVSSNSVETIQTYLEQQGLAQYFQKVYGHASVFAKARKLLQLIDDSNIDPATSWYVGDETRDVIAAKAAGLHVVSVDWGFNNRASLEAKKPDAIADTSQELQKILLKAWKK